LAPVVFQLIPFGTLRAHIISNAEAVVSAVLALIREMAVMAMEANWALSIATGSSVTVVAMAVIT